jgi:hypothetical protein
MDPIAQAFQALAPEAHVFHLLDDSLSKDHAKAQTLTPQMMARFEDLTQYALKTGSQAILFTCSAFGAAIEACAKDRPEPILKPNEAMFEEALDFANKKNPLRVALIATFEPSIASMKEELLQLAQSRGVEVEFTGIFVPEAMKELGEGDDQSHHQRVAKAVAELPACDVIMLAQFSMAQAQALSQAQTQTPVLTSPNCAVKSIMKRLNA